jgi:hypothetical protein
MKRPFSKGGDRRRPEAEDWGEYGKANQKVVGERGAGFETPGTFRDTMIGLAEDEFGPVRVPAHAEDGGDAALGPDAAPNRYAHEAGEVRSSVVRENGQRKMRGPKQTIARAPADGEGAVKEIDSRRSRVERLTLSLPDLRAGVQDALRKVEDCRAALGRLSASQIGYIDSVYLVAAVVAVVSIFDAFVIHIALESSGLSPVSLWGTTLTVPLAVWAINHTLGAVGGAVAIRMRAERIRMAVVAFVAGAGALVVAFTMLAFFRVQAIDSQNQALADLASGKKVDELDFLVNPLWLWPMQVAGSIAAIAMVALWTAGRDGRIQRSLIDKAERGLGVAQVALDVREAQIAAAHDALAAAEQRPFQIRAAAAAAEVDIETEEAVVKEEEIQERALARAMSALYEATFIWVDKLFANGGVVRCAMATRVQLLSRLVTPPPTDRAVDPDNRDEGVEV